MFQEAKTLELLNYAIEQNNINLFIFVYEVEGHKFTPLDRALLAYGSLKHSPELYEYLRIKKLAWIK